MLACQSVQWIKEAIDSVKHQTYGNWELIIVDDASTDGTYELAKALSSNKKIKVWRNTSRLGIVKNRKRAFELTTGELICHLDGDDMLEPWALAAMVNEFAKYPDAALIYSDSMFIGSKSEFNSYSPSPNPNEILKLGWRHLGMFHRSVMDSIDGYNTRLNQCEDGDLFMQIADQFPIHRLSSVLYKHRFHGNNTSSNNAKCTDCHQRPDCNFIRVWAKHAKYDPITYEPLPQES